jgi:hypothetical protein
MLLTPDQATERWKRRQQIESALNPRGTITYEGLTFAINLALEHRWNVAPVASIDDTRANYQTRTIYSSPIHGDAELALFSHEAGHLSDPDIDDKRRGIAIETFGWRWAIKKLGWRWSAAMTREMECCIRTYHGIGLIKCREDLQALEDVIAEGHEANRHIVRMIDRNF